MLEVVAVILVLLIFSKDISHLITKALSKSLDSSNRKLEEENRVLEAAIKADKIRKAKAKRKVLRVTQQANRPKRKLG